MKEEAIFLWETVDSGNGEGEPDIEAVPVNPGSRKPGAIVGIATEDAVLHEGNVIYDIRFSVVTPAKVRVKMYMNIEA